MEIRDFKYSYNKFHKMYRVQIKENGKWRENTYDKKIFEFLITNKLRPKDELRNFSYRPYFLHRAKWVFMNLRNWMNKIEPKLKKFFSGGWGLLLGILLGFIYFLFA